MSETQLKIIGDLNEIPAAQWNALARDDPFLSHAYLHALQASGSASPQYGWRACFITLWQQDALVGAMPLYEKMNSFGELVFDFAWADAYQRHGLHYYPKLVCAVPFTPVTGARLLAATPELRALLLRTALRHAAESGMSSLHCLFLDADAVHEAQAQGMMLRQDVQFHWQNSGYRDFDDFLAALSRDKRKRIQQERRKVREAGIQLTCVSGEHATPQDWAFFERCYVQTHAQHNSPLSLRGDCFQRIGASMPRQTLLVIASLEGRPIASALNFRSGDVLYGRSWGTLEFHSGLHFEACYYTAIEYCIAHGIRTFEGGAQGEHKLARGFMPVTTHSAHWLAHPQFARAVENYLQQETGAVADYLDELNARSPFRQG